MKPFIIIRPIAHLLERKIIRNFILLSLLFTGFLACSDSSDSDTFNSASKYLVLNEVVSKDIHGNNDWIELYLVDDDNAEPVNLIEYSLIDQKDIEVPKALPDIILLPGEYVIIYATDQEPKDGSYWVDFKLGSDDMVALIHDGKRIDTLDWTVANASSGYSYGRFPDGGERKTSLIPTKGGQNKSLSTTSIVINEIVAIAADGATINNDWIEIYNSGDSTADLKGYSISDSGGVDDKELLPNLRLGAKEYLMIHVSPTTVYSQTMVQVTFKLGRGGDSVSLYNQQDELISYLKWEGGQADQGMSFGHYPDATGDTQTLTPTPESSNQALP